MRLTWKTAVAGLLAAVLAFVSADGARVQAAAEPDQIADLFAEKSSARKINLSWTAPNDNGSPITAYHLERKTQATRYVRVTSTIAATATSYTDTGLTPNTQYTYVIRAVNAGGNGPWSLDASDTTSSDVPDAVSDLSATVDATNGATEIDLAWTAPAANGTAIRGYTLQRKAGSGSYANVSTSIAGSATSYSDTGLTPGTTYTYQIRAANSDGNAAWSNDASATTLTAMVPSAITDLSATATSSTAIDLTWSAPADGGDAITGYTIQRKAGSGDYANISTSISASATSYSDTGLTRGTAYTYRIQARNSEGSAAWSNDASATTLTAMVPSAITDLSATATSSTAIDLTWSAPADGGDAITGYTIQRKAGSGDYEDVSTAMASASTGYSDTGLTPITTYTYHVRAANSVGSGGWSNEASATTDPLALPQCNPFGAGCYAPDDIRNLSAAKDGTNGAREIDLAWSRPRNGGAPIRSYTLQRKEGSGDYSSVSANVANSATTYSDTGLTPATTYTYRIRATNSVGDATWSNTPSATTDPDVPDAVADLSAMKDATNGATEIDLAWTAPAANGRAISGYTLQRKAGSGGYEHVATSTSSSTSYTDTGLTPGTTYTYRLRAVNSIGDADWSNTPSETTDTAVPDAITNLTATKDATNGAREIDLTWSPPAANGEAISSYTLRRKAGSGNYEDVSTAIGAGDTSYSDTGLTPATMYTYRIRAVNSVGDAAWSNEPSATTDTAPPDAVADLSATKDATNGSTEIDLSWTAPAANGEAISGYTIRRKAGSGNYADLSTAISATSTSYSDTGLTPGTTYTYQIRAANSVGDGAWSNEPSETTDALAPDAITDLSATKDATNGAREIDLTWTAPANNGAAITGYTLQRKAGSGNYEDVSTAIGASATSYSDTGLTPGTKYTYQIRAANSAGDAEWSNQPSATTDKAAPDRIGDLSAAVDGTNGGTQINLSWTAPAANGAAITGYDLQVISTDPRFLTWGPLPAPSATSTSYSHTGLIPASSYSYRIRAKNSVGNGDWSNIPLKSTDTAAPAAVTNLTATRNGARGVNLSWTAPAAHGEAITGYTLQRKSGSGSYATTTTSIAAGATTYSDTGLTPATAYTYRIRAANSVGDAEWSNTPSATTAAAVPDTVSDLAATAVSSTAIDLTWSAPAANGADITGYTVQSISTDRPVWRFESVAASATSTSYTGLRPATLHSFRIRAANSVGNGAWTIYVSATTNNAPPATVSDLSAIKDATNGGREIDLSWTKPFPNGAAISGYTLQRKSGSGNYADLATSTIAVGADSYTDTDVTPGGTYTYRIRAKNSEGDAAWSNEASETTDTLAPDAITDLTATKDGGRRVDLTWSAPAANGAAISAYTLQRKAGSGSFADIATTTIAATSTSYSDTVTPGGMYTYRLRATNSVGNADWSNEPSATTDTLAPDAITDLTAAPTASDPHRSVDLVFTTPADNGAAIDRYSVRRRPQNSELPEVWNLVNAWTAVVDGSKTTITMTGTIEPGTGYRFDIFVRNSVGNSAGSNVASVTTEATAAPDAITDLSSTSTSARRIDLSWSTPDANGEPISGYTLQRKAGSGSYEDIATTTIAASATAYSDTGLTPAATYTYRIRAVNSRGSAEWSNEPSETTPAAVPDAVTDLSAVKDATNGATQIRLTWTAPNNNGAAITSYTIHRISDDRPTWMELPPISGTSTSYLDTGLTPGNRHAYHIRATNSVGDSDWSPFDALATTDDAPPARITDLYATSTSSTGIDLTWTTPAANGRPITGYTLQRSSGFGNYEDVATTTIAAGDTSYSDTGLAPGVTYVYRLRAANSVGGAEWSNVASATTDAAAPARITDLSATLPSADPYRSAVLSWTVPADNGALITSYTLQRKAGSGNYEDIATSTIETNSLETTAGYTDTGLTHSTAYTYRLRAANSVGDGAWSNELFVTTNAAQVPSALPDLSAAKDGSTAIDLTWTAPDDNGAPITGYTLQRKSGLGSYANVSTTISATSTSYKDTGLTPWERYTYQIRAVNSVGHGAWSNQPSATTDQAPPASTYLRATKQGARSIRLAWDAPVNYGRNFSGYRLERKAGSGDYTLAASPGAGATIYDDTGLTPGTTYTYRIRGVNAIGSAAWSNEPSATTDPDVPDAITDLTAAKGAINGATEIDLSWTAPAANGRPITSYTLQRKAGSGNYADVSPGPVPGDTDYLDAALATSTTYTYRIRAVNSVGSPAWSSTSSATTDAGGGPPPSDGPFDLRGEQNGGSATLPPTGSLVKWGDAPGATSYHFQFSTDGGTTWQPIPPAGHGAGSKEHGLGSTHLTTGSTYWYRVRGVNGGGAGPWDTIDVTPGAPAAYSGFSATTTGASVALTLGTPPTRVFGRAITAVRVERRIGNTGPWEVVGTLGASSSVWTDVTAVGNTTYVYRLRAVNTAGVGDPTPQQSVTLGPGRPGAPTGLSATASTASSIKLEWTAPADDGGAAVSSYSIERADGSGLYAEVSRTAAGETGYEDTGLSPGQTYYYLIRAVNAHGTGGWSSRALATTPATSQPGRITNLSAAKDATDRSTEIDLAWSAPAANGAAISSYRLERKVGSGSYEVIATSTPIAVSATSYSDTDLTPGTTYTYRIRATNSLGDAAWSNESGAMTDDVPDVITDLAATATSSTAIVLSWTAPDDNGAAITSYTLQRKSGTGNYTDVSMAIAGSATGYTDTGLTPATMYTYRMTAFNAVGNTGWSNQPSATTPDAPPARITDLSASVSAADRYRSVSLSWTPPAANGEPITSYLVQRKTGSGNYTTVALLPDTGLTPGTTYMYRVRAVNAVGSALWSNVASVTTVATAAPDAVTDLAATTTSARGIDLSWSTPDANGEAISSYTIQRKSGSGNYADIATSTIAAGATAYTDTGLTPGASYTYRIRARNSVGDGAWSNEPSATTPAAPPDAITDLTATAASSTQIRLTWTPPAANGAAINSYTIERKAGSGSFVALGTGPGAAANSFTDYGLTPSTTYTYRMTAFNVEGGSDWSNEATATTPSAQAPSAVANLAATAASSTQIRLTWTAPSDGGSPITGYTLQRKSGSGSYTNVSTTISATATSYLDTGLTPGTTYTYQISARNSEGAGAWSSNEPSATTNSAAPAAVADLSAATASSTAISLSWTAPNAHGEAISGYRLERKAGSDSFALVSSSIAGGATTYTDTGLTPATTYTYRIRAANSEGNGAWSNEPSATTANAAPAAITDLRAAKDATNPTSTINLAWTAPAAHGAAITGYTLQRKIGTGNYEDVSTAIAAGATTYSDTDLTPGTQYTYRIRAVNSVGNGDWSNEPSAATDNAAPAAITDLSAAAATSTVIDLSWTAPAAHGAAISGYTLQRKSGSGSFANVSTTIAAGATTYTDTGLTPATTYTYRIRAANSVGDADWSNEPSAKTDNAVPDAVEDLSAAKDATNPTTQIRLTWTAPNNNGADITSYTIQRISDDRPTWTELPPISGTSTSYLDTGLTPGNEHSYNIRATNSVGDAEWSNFALATTDSAPPAAVTDLSATATSSTEIVLSWTAPAAHGEAITGYTLQRKSGSGNYKDIATTTIAASATSYSDTGLTPATEYTYRIRATNSEGDAAWSNEDSATTDNAAPAAITDLSATAASSVAVNLSWTAPAAHGEAITGYRLERKAGTGNYGLVSSTIAASATTYSDTGLTPETTYTYRLRAANSIGDAAWSNEAPETTPAPGAPEPVSDLSATWDATNGGTDIDLSWTAPNNNGSAITGYRLERKAGTGNYGLVSSTISATSTTYTDTGLTPATQYTYRIRARNSVGNAAWSNESSAMTGTAAPAAVSNLSATKDGTNGSTEIDLTWTAPSDNGDAITGYTLQRKEGSGGVYADVSMAISATSTSYSDTGLTPGTTYTYRIRAVNSIGDAGWSNEPTATTDNAAPAAITNLRATKDGAREIDLSWTAPAAHGQPIQRYTLQRKTGSGIYTDVSTAISATSTTYSDTGLTPATTYTYRIRAVNSVGNADWSNEDDATTDAAAPAAVSNLSATKLDSTRISLSWSAPNTNGAPIINYAIERKAGSGNYAHVATRQASAIRYTDTGLTPGTQYTYRIRAANSIGSAEWSNEPSATTDATAPARITGLSATKDATNGSTQINLSWTAPAANGEAISSYTLRRKTGSGDYADIATSTIAAGDTSYSDTGLTPATTYTYQIRAVNSVGNADWSNEADATTDAAPPDAITDLAATKDATNGSTEIDLSWTTPAANGAAISSYTIERKAGPGSFTQLSGSPGPAATSYRDTGLTPGTTYTYRLRAWNTQGAGAWSNEADATTDATAPARITDLSATKDATNGAREIDLSWTAPAANGAAISGYTLQRKSGSLSYEVIATTTIAVSATSYTDTGLTPGTAYTYRIRAANSVGNADWSNEDDATTDAAAPAAITDLDATAASSVAIRLTWSAPAAHGASITSYRLERKAGSGNFALATTTTIALNATSWLDTGLTPSATYTYRLRAANSIGDAEWSNEAPETTPAPGAPEPVSDLVAAKDATNGSTEIDLTWSAPADNGAAISGYRLERKAGPGSYVVASSTIDAAATSYTDTGLTPGTAYTYRIHATNSAGDGAWSTGSSATTDAAAPAAITDLDATPDATNGSTEIDLSWTPPAAHGAAISGYRLERKEGSGPYTLVSASISAGAASYSDTGRTPGTTYTYRIRAANSEGSADWSNEDDATTENAAPARITDLSASVASSTAIRLTWTTPAAHGAAISSYRLERKAGPGSFALATTTTIAVTATSWLDTGLTPGTTYTYRLRAANSVGAAEWSNESNVIARDPAPPDAVTNLSATPDATNGSTEVDLTWTAPDDSGQPITSYTLQRKSGSGNYANVSPAPSVGDTSYSDTGLTAGTAYTYRIRAENSEGPGEWSNEASATTQGGGGGGGGGGAFFLPPTGPAPPPAAPTTNVIALDPAALSFTVRQGGGNPSAKTFAVWNTKFRGMVFKVSENVRWLTSTLSEDRSNGPGDPAQVSVSANVAGLSVGTHTGLLQIVSGTAENSPQTVTVRLTVIGAEADWGVAGPGRSARIETPDGSAELAVSADAASAAVEIRLTRLDVSTLSGKPAEIGRVALAVELDTFDANTGVLKPTEYSSAVTLRLRLPEDDGAACGDGRAQVYRVSDGGRWTLLTHRCETDDSGRVWAVAALTNFSRYVLTIGGTPAVPATTPTPRPAATATPAPAVTPTPAPVTTPTPAPAATATPRPAATATPRPVTTATPAPAATATPRPVTTATPRPVTTATPAPVRTATPAPVRTATPAPVRTPTPAPAATATPTPAPTATPAPVAAALATPTPAPTAAPTAQTEDGEDRGGGGALWLILGGLLVAVAIAAAGAFFYFRLYRKPQGLTPPANPGQA